MSIDQALPRTDMEHEAWSASWDKESLEIGNIKSLISDLTPSPEVVDGRKYGVHVLDGSDPNSDIARYIELSVFDKYFKNDINVMKEAYAPLDSRSKFILVIDYEKQEPVGTIRLVEPSEESSILTIEEVTKSSSPWHDDRYSIVDRLTEIGNDPEHTLDITTMAVMPDYRTAHALDGPSAVLYSTCVRWSLAHDYNIWTTIVDKNIFEMMQSWGEPFKPFDGLGFAPYMGSKASIPVHTELYSGLDKVRAFDEGVYRLYTESAGLEHQYVLPEVD